MDVRRYRRQVWLLWVLLAWLGLGTGCSRQHFRERADRDVEALISQKNVFLQWRVENWHVYPDHRARFADPASPDHPPYPPDDYAARMLSPNPQRPGQGGSGRFEGDGYLQMIQAWDAQNRAENPDGASLPSPVLPSAETKDEAFRNALSTMETPYRLKLDQTVDLALFNSREFQDRREDLYLAALPVTLERFNLAAQWFSAQEGLREWAGRGTNNGGGQRWRLGSENTVNRRFTTGAELIFRLANQIVIDVRDKKPTVSVSTLGLSLVQPLLRGAGFAVNLEALTQVERTLLYAIRSYARFRSVFYGSIVAGIDNTNNPYGLQGLAANLGRGVGANLTARPVGYLSASLRSAILANEEKNVETVQQFLRLFENLKEGGAIQELQVVRVQQRLLSSRAQVLRRQQEYKDTLDNFKLQLGVPATLPLELDDAPLRPLRRQLLRYEEIYDQLLQVEKAAAVFDPAEAPERYRERWAKLLTESPLARGTDTARTYTETAAALRKLTDDQILARVKDLLEQRRKLLDAKAARQLQKQPEPAAAAAALAVVEVELDRLRFEQQLRRYESKPWLKLPNDRHLTEQLAAFRQTLEAGLLVALQVRAQRLATVRTEWPVLPPAIVDDIDVVNSHLDVAYAKVTEAALNNRFDLMNARAQVVDSWRRITVIANSLQSVFDVGYDLNVTTPANGNQPFGFSASRVLQEVRLRFEPPFVRRLERNQYRTQLISYQRQRRNLQSFEDNIATDVRTDLRTVRQLAQAYQLQVRAVELAYAQVENARSTFLAPPDPLVRDTAGNVAALTQQLLEAQGQLVQAQNDLYTTWTNYLTARIELYLDMELLNLDSRGQWNDELTYTTSPAQSSNPGSAPERLPAPVPLSASPLPPVELPLVELPPLPGDRTARPTR